MALDINLNFITKEDFDRPRKVNVNGEDHFISKSKLLGLLFASKPNQKVFYKNERYKLKLVESELFPGSPPIKVKLTLNNDIVHRTSAKLKKPYVIFKPVMIDGERIIKPHIIYKRVSSEENAPRYSVLSSDTSLKTKEFADVGRGTFGSVFSVVGTLAPLPDNHWDLKTHKKRIIKAFNPSEELTPEEYQEEIEAELNFLLTADHLGAKNITSERDENLEIDENLIVQKKGGTELTKLIEADQDKENPKRFSVAERYKISINILRALKEQVHDRGIVSRDIKPHNILIDPVTLEVLMIDFGLAKIIINSKDSASCGTRMYVSPEVWSKQPADERADFFSVALTLSPIWGQPLGSLPKMLRRLKGEQEDFTDLNVQDLNQEDIENITKVLAKLANNNKENRGSLDTAIKTLEIDLIKHQHQLSNDVFQKQKASIISSLNLGADLREELKALANADEYVIENLLRLINQLEEKKKEKTLTEEEQELLDFANITQSSLNKIVAIFKADAEEGKITPIEQQNELEKIIAEANLCITAIKKALNASPLEKLHYALLEAIDRWELKDTPASINAFTQALGISQLNDIEITSKRKLIKKIDNIINAKLGFINTVQEQLQKLRNHKFNLPQNQIKQDLLINHLKSVLHKFENPTLEELFDVRRITYIEKQVSDFIDKQTALEEKCKLMQEKMDALLDLRGSIEMQLEASDQVPVNINNKLKGYTKKIDKIIKQYKKLDLNAIDDPGVSKINEAADQLIDKKPAIAKKLSELKTLNEKAKAIEISLTGSEEDFDTELIIDVKGAFHTISKSKFLSLLFASRPDQKVFYKSTGLDIKTAYPLTSAKHALFPGSPEMNLNIFLRNDIVKRTSSKQKKPKVIFKPVMVGGKRILKPKIIYKLAASEEDAPRYSVLSSDTTLKTKASPMGKGSFGFVFSIIGTLAPLPDNNLDFKTHKKRVLKAFKLSIGQTPEEYQEDIEAEHNFLLAAEHLRAKNITNEGKEDLIVQRKGEMTLTQLINDLPSEQLTIEKRYKISINILRALKEQVHDRGIVSLDVKPDNILIDPLTLEVLMIDFGLAKIIINSQDKKSCGTPEFMALEVIQNKPADERADFFSAALTLRYVWGKPLDPTDLPLIIRQKRLDGKPEDFTGLFEGLEGQLHGKSKDNLQKNVILKLSDMNKENRGSLDEAIRTLEIDLIKHQLIEKGSLKIANFDEELSKSITAALDMGTNLREELKALANPDEHVIENLAQLINQLSKDKTLSKNAQPILKAAKTTQLSLNKLVKKFEKNAENGNLDSPEMQNELEKLITDAKFNIAAIQNTLKLPTQPIEKLHSALIHAIYKSELEDNPQSISTFTQALGIKCLNNIKDKTMLTAEVNQIINTANENFKNLKNTQQDLMQIFVIPQNQIQQKELFNKLNTTLDKLTNSTLDQLYELNKVDETTKLSRIDEIINQANAFIEKQTALEKKCKPLLAMIDRLLDTRSRLERQLNLPTKHNQSKPDKGLSMVKKYFGECIVKVDKTLQLYKNFDLTSFDEKAANKTNTDANQLLNEIEKNITAYTSELKKLDFVAKFKPLPARKKLAELSLNSRIQNIKNFDELRDFYHELKQDYNFLRREQGFFGLFQATGRTATWGRVIKALQEKTFELIKANHFDVTQENVKKLCDSIFSQKTKRVQLSNKLNDRYFQAVTQANAKKTLK